jgi:hypothetical protein
MHIFLYHLIGPSDKRENRLKNKKKRLKALQDLCIYVYTDLYVQI